MSRRKLSVGESVQKSPNVWDFFLFFVGEIPAESEVGCQCFSTMIITITSSTIQATWVCSGILPNNACFLKQ